MTTERGRSRFNLPQQELVTAVCPIRPTTRNGTLSITGHCNVQFQTAERCGQGLVQFDHYVVGGKIVDGEGGNGHTYNSAADRRGASGTARQSVVAALFAVVLDGCFVQGCHPRRNPMPISRRMTPLFTEIQPGVESIPAELAGCWKVGERGSYEITSAGQYLVVSTTRFSVSKDGQLLTMHAPNEEMVFSRKYGVGTDIVGVWSRTFQDPDTPTATPIEEEVFFRSDGTEVWHWGNELDTSCGLYAVSGNQLTTREFRAITMCEDKTIRFLTLGGVMSVGTYVLESNKLTTTFPNGVLVYHRIPCG